MFFSIVFDILLMLIVLTGILLGIKRGFVKTVAKPVRFFASLITAFYLSSPISVRFIEPLLKAPLANQIKTYLYNHCPNITPETASEELPSALKFAATSLGVDVSSLPSENTISAIVDALANPVVHFISVIITFIALYFIAKLVYTLLISLLSTFFDKGFLTVPNKVLGSVFNALAAVVIAWFVAIAFDFVIHLPALSGITWLSGFEGGFVYNLLNRLNPMDILLGF